MTLWQYNLKGKEVRNNDCLNGKDGYCKNEANVDFFEVRGIFNLFFKRHYKTSVEKHNEENIFMADT